MNLILNCAANKTPEVCFLLTFVAETDVLAVSLNCLSMGKRVTASNSAVSVSHVDHANLHASFLAAMQADAF